MCIRDSIPPGQAARDAADVLRRNNSTTNTTELSAEASVIDLSVYERATQNRTHLP